MATGRKILMTWEIRKIGGVGAFDMIDIDVNGKIDQKTKYVPK